MDPQKISPETKGTSFIEKSKSIKKCVDVVLLYTYIYHTHTYCTYLGEDQAESR
jgi:hypothetical protein